MRRKRLVLFFFLLSAACGLWLHRQGEMPAQSVPAFLLTAAAGAFRMPGTLYAMAAAWLFGRVTGASCMVALSLIFWLVPLSRLRRCIGIYDPFEDSGKRRPLLLSALAFLIDVIDKRLFGRRKTGGWA